MMKRDPFSIKNLIDNPIAHDLDAQVHTSFEADVLDSGEAHGHGTIFLTPVRINYLWVAVLLAAAILIARIVFLTVFQFEDFRLIADGNRLRIEYLSAPRGAVYDRNSELIAGNRPSFELVAVPIDLPREESRLSEVLAKVEQVTGVSQEEAEQKIFEAGLDSFQSVLIKQNISREQALVFHEIPDELTGFRVVNTPIRDYKDSFAFAHLLGYVGKVDRDEYQNRSGQGYLFNDSIGKTGLELTYEDFLRGQFGQRQIEVDAFGVVKKVYGEKNPVPGGNLYLNIDAELQRQLYEILSNRIALINKKRAAAIAMDPRNGRVLAIVSLPSYDNNKFAEGIDSGLYNQLLYDENLPLFNRSIRGTYPPGSTVKPMVALAALQEGVVTPRTVINDQGYIVIENIYGGPDAYFYGFNRRALGRIDVKSAIAKSSNIFFYIAGGGYEREQIDGLGIHRLAYYYRQFMLDRILGIDLPGEKAGLVPTPEWKQQRFPDDPLSARWFLGNTYYTAIGQGDVLASPLHVLSWIASIANGGTIYKPFIVDRVVSNDGDELLVNAPKALASLPFDDEYIKIVQDGMRQTVVDGTAIFLNSLSVPAAGKTGSSQFDASNLSRAHAWFSGYLPFDDPEIALIVLVEDGGTETASSVPVAREVFDWWIKNRM